MEPSVIKINRHTSVAINSPKFSELNKEKELSRGDISDLITAKQEAETSYIETDSYVYLYVAPNSDIHYAK